MMKKVWVLFFVLVFVLPSVLGDGVCSLDRDDEYHPGERASFSCACDSAAEENRAGFIVFQNSSDILSNDAVNSGACTSSFFGDTFLFPVGANYTGNVTFSLNANGTGSPTNWGGVGDVTSDTFNVTGAHIVDCVIENITVEGDIVIGQLFSIAANVRDAVTLNPLVRAQCDISFHNIDEEPLLFEPYGPGDTDRFSSHDGLIGFQHVMVEKVWVVDTTYILDMACHCINGTIEGCIDDEDGSDPGFKSCGAELLVSTGSDDFRNEGNILGIMVAFIFIVVYFGAMGWVSLKFGGINGNKKAFWVGVFNVALTIIEFVFMVGVLYFNELGRNLGPLLRVNFFIILVLSFGVAMLSLFFLYAGFMDFDKNIGGNKEW